MAKTDKTALKAFMLVNKFEPEYWGWARREIMPPDCPRDSGRESDLTAWAKYERDTAAHVGIFDALNSARAGDVSLLVEWVAARLNLCGVAAVHGIIHDADKIKEWDKVARMYVEAPKDAHAHILVLFIEENGYNANRTLGNIAAALGVEPQMVEKPKPGRHSIDNMMAYLIHAKDPEKAQYSAAAVYSCVPIGSKAETYSQIFAEKYDDWMVGRAKKTAKQAAVKVDSMIIQINEGKLTEDQILLDPEMREVYARYRKRIKDALDIYGQSRVTKAKAAMAAGEFKTVVVFVYGQPRSGKTHLAEEISKALIERSAQTGEVWQVLTLAGSHSVDKYRGQEILLGNDLEQDTMSCGEWKRLLDNSTAEEQTARYQNVTVAARVIILSAAVSPADFFLQFALTGENIDQFLGRIGAVVEVVEPHPENPTKTKFRIGARKIVDQYPVFNIGDIVSRFKFVFSRDSFLSEEAVLKMLNMVDLYALPAAAWEFPKLPFSTVEDTGEKDEEQMEIQF